MRVFVAHPFSQIKEGYREALARAAQGTDIDLNYADSRIENKHILEKIRTQMADADLCLFDLTDSNPNVTLEFGIAMEAEHPSILAVPEAGGPAVIADLAGWDSIRYASYDDLGNQLVSRIRAAEVPTRSKTVGLADIEAYLANTHYGLQDTGRPQASIAIVPMPLKEDRLNQAFLDQQRSQETGMLLNRLVTTTINETKLHRDFFPLADVSYKPFIRERYFEYFAVDIQGNATLWSIKLYQSGMVVYRTPIMYHDFPLTLDRFRGMIVGTCVFTAKVFGELGIRVGNVCVASFLLHPDQGKLAVPAPAGMFSEVRMSEPQPDLRIPTKLRATPVRALTADADAIARRLAQELRDCFEPSLDRFMRS